MNEQSKIEEEARKQREAIDALVADCFNISDRDRVKRLSQKLVETKRGWLDENIGFIVKPQDIPPLSDGFLYWNYPLYYNYLQNISRYYWFIITIPEGVSAGNFFIDHTRDSFVQQFNACVGTPINGKILFYEINRCYISLIIQVYQPCQHNIELLTTAFQTVVNQLYKLAYASENCDWRVSSYKIEEYNDIPVTLRQLEKNLGLSSIPT